MKLVSLLKLACRAWKVSGFRYMTRCVNEYLFMRKYHRWRRRLFGRARHNTRELRNVLGSLMCLDLQDEGINRDLFLDGIREPMATAHTLHVLRPEDVVLEIGANIGYYVLLSAKRCKKVYAIEPHPVNIDLLMRNVALNECRNVEIHALAFGENRGVARMFVGRRYNWHSFRQTSSTTGGQVEVRMETVDDFLEGRISPTFARMDVEGYELQILRGMRRTLPKLRYLFVEVHADLLQPEETREVMQIISEAGLRPELIVKRDRPGLSELVPTDRISLICRGDVVSYEVFFSRSGARLTGVNACSESSRSGCA